MHGADVCSGLFLHKQHIYVCIYSCNIFTLLGNKRIGCFFEAVFKLVSLNCTNNAKSAVCYSYLWPCIYAVLDFS